MSFAQKLAITAGYVLLLVGIGTADAIVTTDTRQLPTSDHEEDSVLDEENDDLLVDGTPVVIKDEGPDVFDVLTRFNIATQIAQEQSLIRRVIPASVQVDSRVLLQSNDRIAFLSWVESPDVKSYFTALKEALHASFSENVQDLIDEVQDDPTKPTRYVLSFLDPAIHEDRLLFVRVRQRLYEFHVAPGREPEVQELLDALTE